MTAFSLAQLPVLLDGHAMAPILESACLYPSSGLGVRQCRVEHVRYRPGKNCLVRYDVDLTSGTQSWYGLAYPRGASGQRWAKAQQSATIPVSVGPGVAHLDALDTIVWAFPNDRKLRGIDLLLDPARLGREAFGSDSAVRSTGIVRYIPEHGCTAKVVTPTGNFYAKILSGGADATVVNARALGREAWHAGGISMQREVGGVPADESTDLEACARALAHLHRANLPNLPAAPDPEWRERIAKARLLLRDACSALRLLEEAERRFAPCATVSTVHGDAHIRNFLVSGSHAEIIDLDTLHTGDPLDDLAGFAAGLYHRALIAGAPADRTDEAVTRFIETYAAEATLAFDNETLSARIALSLIAERACRAIVRHKGDVVDALLAIAGRHLHFRRIGPVHAASARDWMELYAAKARARAGQILDVHYKTYRKEQSWSRSGVTVAWRNETGVCCERIGPEPEAWAMTHDPAIASAPVVTDSRAVLPYLPVSGARDTVIDVLNYRPGNRLTVKYTVTTGYGPLVVYGKTYADERGAAIFDRLLRLQDLGLPMPAPLAYTPDIHTFWQAAFEGEPLFDRIDSPGADRLLAETAERIRFVHRCGLACPPRLDIAAQHRDLSKKMAKLATVTPELATRLTGIAAGLAERADSLSPGLPGVVHGDFHLRQLMSREASNQAPAVALFDFDETSLGDTVEDLGHFIADLHSYGWPCERVDRVRGALLAHYGPVPDDRLRWHTALQLLTRAYRALLQLRPDFDARVHRFLQLAEKEQIA